MLVRNIVTCVLYISYFACGVISLPKLRSNVLQNTTYVDNLKHDILLNYDKFSRPAEHDQVTGVKFGMEINYVNVNEFKSTVTLHNRITFEWVDQKLKWEPEDYGGLNKLNLAEHEIWLPDLYVYNRLLTIIPITAEGFNCSININQIERTILIISTTEIGSYANTPCIVTSEGTVTWIPPTQFIVLCKFNLTYWPFDTQSCYMKIGSWTAHGEQIDLLVDDTTQISQQIDVDSEWKLLKLHVEKNVNSYECCGEHFPEIVVNFTLSRIAPSYKTIVITPIIVIIVMALANFWLPPNTSEKIWVNISIIIVICLFMLYLAQKIPAMGSHTPIIVLYFGSCLNIALFTLVGSVTVITLSRTKHNTSLPWIFKRLLTGNFGKVLGLRAYIEETKGRIPNQTTVQEMQERQVTDFENSVFGEEHIVICEKKQCIQKDWILLAAAVDRLSFCLYVVLFAILAIMYS